MLQEWYEVAGVDINPALLDVARTRCPNVTFSQADMTDFTLDRTFDVVTCLFGSIAYVRHSKDLRVAVANLARCVNPGGILVLEPWFSEETYWDERLTADFVNQADLKVARMYVSRKAASLAILDIHYLVGCGQSISSFTERHELGLFSQREYTSALQQAGLEVSYDPVGLFGWGMYIGARRP
jgi:ubiquinone/menaquinone biosynthesis C-methylase UbiE